MPRLCFFSVVKETLNPKNLIEGSVFLESMRTFFFRKEGSHKWRFYQSGISTTAKRGRWSETIIWGMVANSVLMEGEVKI